MTERMQRLIPLVIAFGIVTLGSLAHAGTTTYAAWSQYCVNDSGCEQEMGETHSIQYAADAIDSSGASVCSGTVPVGQQVHFTFADHTPQDVTWFIAGGPWDSPYGQWDSNIQPWHSTQDSYITQSGTGWQSWIANVVARTTERRSSGWFNESEGNLLVMKPPAQSVSGIASLFDCGAPDVSGSVTCTASHEGSGTAVFNFAATYGGYYSSDYANAYGGPSNQLYQDYVASANYYYQLYPQWFSPPESYDQWLQEWLAQSATTGFDMPAQTISCPVTVTPPANTPPTPPTVEPSGSCTVGTNYSVGMHSSDPDADQVYYKVYWLWDSDQSSYERVPAAGYVTPSQLQVATHQYATPGSHAVAVVAVDSRGSASGVSSVLSFSCAPAPPPPTATLTADSTHIHVGQSTIVHATYHAGIGDTLTSDNIDSPLGTGLGATVNPDAAKDITFTPLLPGTYTFYARATTSYYPIWATYADPLTITVDLAPVCTPSDTYTCENNNTVIVKTSLDNACNTTVTRTTCPAGAYCQAGSSTCHYPAVQIDVHLKVTPSLVRTGDKTRVKWAVENVASCEVVGNNGDHWYTASSDPSGELSRAIFQQTIYTMTCVGLDGSHPDPESATVTVLPIFIEQ